MAVFSQKYFWWITWTKKVIFDPFWWVILVAIIFFVPFLRVWWWFFVPLILSIELRTLYLWWLDWDFAYTKRKWVVLEVVPPKEVLVPLKAMEDIFSVMWGPQPPNWREKWCEGVLEEGANWMSWEIASIEGNLHFYIRVGAESKLTLETALYGYYPNLEIREVPDYTKNVPQNIPNKEWDAYGEDFVLVKPSYFPIKTYEKFFEPQGEKIADEEKRIDPMSSLLELMSKLGPGEQYWMQFITMPDDGAEVKEGANKEIGKLAKRPTKTKKTLWSHIVEMAFHLVRGPLKEGGGESASYHWLEDTKSESGEREMVLTPGEKDVILDVENKTRKPIFRTNIRGVYVAKRENFVSGNRVLARSYLAHFGSPNSNSFLFSKITRPKTHYVLRNAIPFIRIRRQFRNYVLRFTPLFPERKGEMALLNTEELATIYHFPLKITGLVAPTMARVESKKGGPPPNLPTG